MQSIQSELERIKKFIEKQIKANKFKMLRELDEGEDMSDAELVYPKVVLGNLPHSNFSLYGAEVNNFAQAPYFLVGYEKANFNADDESIRVLIQGCCYTADAYKVTEDGILFPDNMGAVDVTTMLETLMQWIQLDSDFPVDISEPYEIGTYSIQSYTYPYNYGYLTFNLHTTVGTMRSRKASDLMNYLGG